MKAIPVAVAENIAKGFDFDQVVIVARQVGENGGEHVTTYGKDVTHCAVAAQIGNHLKYEVMKWPMTPESMREEMLAHLRIAEKLSYEIFCNEEVGPARIKAHDIYENIRNATRVG